MNESNASENTTSFYLSQATEGDSFSECLAAITSMDSASPPKLTTRPPSNIGNAAPDDPINDHYNYNDQQHMAPSDENGENNNKNNNMTSIARDDLDNTPNPNESMAQDHENIDEQHHQQELTVDHAQGTGKEEETIGDDPRNIEEPKETMDEQGHEVQLGDDAPIPVYHQEMEQYGDTDYQDDVNPPYSQPEQTEYQQDKNHVMEAIQPPISEFPPSSDVHYPPLVAETPMTTPMNTPSKKKDNDDGKDPSLKPKELLSPFSPNLGPKGRASSFVMTHESLDILSMAPARKVSLVVRVLPATEDDQQCVFNLSEQDTRGLVIVNPSAIGNHIPSEVTLETARLVAEVAKMESEDWLRQYKLDHVEWGSDDSRILQELAQSLANDINHTSTSNKVRGKNSGAGSPRHRVVLGMGPVKSGDVESSSSHLLSDLMTHTFAHIIIPQFGACTLSIMEIVDEDNLRDCLDMEAGLRIRYPDHQGAVVQNLTERTVDSIDSIKQIVRKATSARRRSKSNPGHVISTLKVWSSAVDQDLNHLSKCAMIQFVDLASGEDQHQNPQQQQPPSSLNSNQRRLASIRKSLSALRGILRNLVVRDQSVRQAGTAHVVPSFRECSLTKILQRSLEPDASKVVLVGTISGGSKGHERSLHTLNYLNRLFMRPGKTAESPFHPTSPVKLEDTSEGADILADLASQPAFLENVVKDPRQRLARVMPKSSPKISPMYRPHKLSFGDDEPEYEPTNYMDVDPTDFFPQPLEKRQKGSSHRPHRTPTKTRNRTASPVRNSVDSSSNGRRHRPSPSPHKGVSSKSSLKSSPSSTGTPRKDVSFADDVDNTKPRDSNDRRKPSPKSKSNRHPSGLPRDAHSKGTRPFGYDPQRLSGSQKKPHTHNKESMVHDEDFPRQTSDEFPPQHDPEIGMSNMMPRPQERAAVGGERHTRMGRMKPEDEALLQEWGNAGLHGEIPTHARELQYRHSKPNLISENKSFFPDSKPQHSSSAFLRTALQRARAGSETRGDNGATQKSETPSSPTRFQQPMTSSVRAEVDRRMNERTQDDSAGLDDSFMEDLIEIQSAVDQMRTTHVEMWQTGASSLERLQQYLFLQQTLLQKAIAERREAEEKLRLSEEEYERRLSGEARKGDRQKRELNQLKERLQDAKAHQGTLERVAEEAVKASEKLETDLAKQAKDLERTKQESDLRYDDYNRLVESKDNLFEELKAARTKLTGMNMERSDAAMKITGLESTAKQLTKERDRLRIMREKDRIEMENMRKAASKLADVENQLQNTQMEFEKVKAHNQEMNKQLENAQDSANADIREREEEAERLRDQIHSLEFDQNQKDIRAKQELASCQQLCDDLREQNGNMEQQLQHMANEQDHLQQLRANDQETMGELRAEITMKEDFESQYLAAMEELDLIRSMRTKEQQELDEMRANFASEIEERDHIISQLRAQLHQHQMELANAERSIELAEEATARAREDAAHDSQALQDLLDSSSNEIKRLEAAAEQAAKQSENSLLDASLTVSAREEEIKALKKKIEELMKEKQENELRYQSMSQTLNSKLSSFREEQKDRLNKMMEQKRENDENMRQVQDESREFRAKSQKQEETLARLRHELEQTRKTVSVLNDDLDLAQSQKEEVESALGSSRSEAKLQKKLVDELRHQLEIAEIRANDDLLKKTREENRELQSSNSRLSGQVGRLERELQDAKASLDTTRSRFGKAQESRVTMEAESSRLEAKLAKSQTTINELRKELQITRDRSFENARNADKERNRGEANSFRRERESFARSLSDSQRHIDSLRKQKVQLERKVTSTETELDELKEELDELKRKPSPPHGSGTENEVQLRSLRLDLERSRREHVRNSQDDARKIEMLERENSILRRQASLGTDREKVNALTIYTEESSRREQAEELLAIFSARAKTKMEKQNEEIYRLKMKLSQVFEEKEAEIRTLRNRILDMERSSVDDGEARPALTWRFGNELGDDDI